MNWLPIADVRVNGRPGCPRLLVNGIECPPLVFFFNPGQTSDYLHRFQLPQLRMASAHGFHIHSMMIPSPHYWAGSDAFKPVAEVLDSFIEADPQAALLPRIWPGPNPGWPEWRQMPEGERMRYADGHLGPISITSSWFDRPSDERLAELIGWLERHYGDRLLGIHVGGPDCEMFPPDYRERGPDISEASTRRFRRWLARQYRNAAVLSRSWKRDVTFETAQVPRDASRFPMRMAPMEQAVSAFYSDEERDWIDYSRFLSEVTAQRICSWARLIKRVTRGRRLSVFFYGYHFELPGSAAGHYALRRVLSCRDVDVLVSPVPYQQRGAGGPAGFMSPVDSVTRAGKLWWNEDDLRTHLVDPADLPAWLTDGMFGDQSPNLRVTLGLLERQVASIAAHRAGCWWMDLSGAGAYQDERIWHRFAVLRDRLWPVPDTPCRPDIALVSDEASRFFMRSDWDLSYETAMHPRSEALATGMRVGLYMLDDLLSGKLPDSVRCAFLPHAFNLTASQRRVIDRLVRGGLYMIWLYAPGWFRGAERLGVTGVSHLTGIPVSLSEPKPTRTQGVGVLDGLSWGSDRRYEPSLVIPSCASVTVLAVYEDGSTAAAMQRCGKGRHVLVLTPGLSAEALARLFELCGARRVTRQPAPIYGDERFTAVHMNRGEHHLIDSGRSIRGEPGDTIWVDASGRPLDRP